MWSQVYRNGQLEAEVTDITAYWTADMTCFYLGCSFSFEAALARVGVCVCVCARACGCVCVCVCVCVCFIVARRLDMSCC